MSLDGQIEGLQNVVRALEVKEECRKHRKRMSYNLLQFFIF